MITVCVYVYMYMYSHRVGAGDNSYLSPELASRILGAFSTDYIYVFRAIQTRSRDCSRKCTLLIRLCN